MPLQMIEELKCSPEIETVEKLIFVSDFIWSLDFFKVKNLYTATILYLKEMVIGPQLSIRKRLCNT